jgi:flagellar biosynthesis protein
MNKQTRPERKTAVALRRTGRDQVPAVLAKGKGMAAERILEKAKEHGVPIHNDPALAELLGQLELNEVIPEQLYRAVAEVFAFIYQLDRKMGE